MWLFFIFSLYAQPFMSARDIYIETVPSLRSSCTVKQCELVTSGSPERRSAPEARRHSLCPLCGDFSVVFTQEDIIFAQRLFVNVVCV